MSPTRFPRIRVDLSRLGLGRVQITTGAKTKREHEQRVALFHDLVENGQVAVLKALISDGISWEELRDQKRRHGQIGANAIGDIKLRRPLVEAVTDTLPRMGKTKHGRARYRLSLTALMAKAGPVLVEDLALLDWPTIHAEWGKSPSDWMHLRRAVSAFLTKYLGSEHHPFRTTEVMPHIPTVEENERVPDLTPELFWRIVARTPAHVQACYVTLLLTGMRDRSEYLRCTADNKMPAVGAVKIPGKKTRRAAGVVHIEPEWWPYIDAGIPSPVRYKMLRLHWVRACVAEGAGKYAPRYVGLRLHDLRHALGQWATDADVPIGRVMSMLRHTNIAMTERYARVANTKAVARAVGGMLGGGRR